MSNVFEIIDAIIAHKGCSLRELAIKADITYTTLASIMTRRSSRISKKIVTAIAEALEVDFYDLIPRESDLQATKTDSDIVRYPTDCSEEFMKATLQRIIGADAILYIPENNLRRARNIAMQKTEHMPVCPNNARHQFKQSIDFVLNKLNDEGLMEAMRRVLDIAQDPKFCISTATENKKENAPSEET